MELGAFSVSLAVKDIHASKAFYEKLGFQVFMGEAAQNWLILKNGATVIGLFQGMFDRNTLTFNMVIRRYPEYRDASAVEPINPHLHNVPMQIAAERGLPGLAAWLAFVVVLARDLWRRFRSGSRTLAGAGLASLAAMLSAGFFVYNFGDSEFLMLFLGLITLPFAARQTPS